MELFVIVAVTAALVGVAVLVKPSAREQTGRGRSGTQRERPTRTKQTPPSASPPSEPVRSCAPRRPSSNDRATNQPPESTPSTSPPDQPSIRSDLLLSCLGFLRFEVGTDWSGVMEPFPVDPKDPIAVNDAVKRLAAHAGLHGLRFIVGIGNDGTDAGGRSEFSSGQEEVFIEISKAASVFGPSLLAVLAHEVCHKVLFDRLIHQQGNDARRYEVLTDMTAVYLGFGKLLLNGYEYATTRRRSAGAERHARNVRFGHLSLDEVAFAHAMACSMRELRSPDWYLGLSPHARRTMSRVVHDDDVRRILATAPTLRPQKSYLRPPRRPEAPTDGEARRPSRIPSRDGAEPPQPDHQPRHSGQRQRAADRASVRPGDASRRMPTRPSSTSPDIDGLHDQLLTLVYGDARLVRRLVDFERRRHLTLEASYRAAIERLHRDRA